MLEHFVFFFAITYVYQSPGPHRFNKKVFLGTLINKNIIKACSYYFLMFGKCRMSKTLIQLNNPERALILKNGENVKPIEIDRV